MNARLLRLGQELFAAVVVAIGLGWGFNALSTAQTLPIALWLCPLIWLGLRYGGAAAIVASALSGIGISFLQGHTSSVQQFFLLGVLPLLVSGVAGFFAKYTQKTLNNRRLSSTYLNIVTATLCVTVGYYGLRFWIMPLLLGSARGNSQTLIGCGVTFAIIAIILCLCAKFAPKTIIPKRSKYLSRKETSILLND